MYEKEEDEKKRHRRRVKDNEVPKASTTIDLVPERGMCGAQNIGKERLTTVCFLDIERPRYSIHHNNCLFLECFCFRTDSVSTLLIIFKT